jgi:hypothetical protein
LRDCNVAEAEGAEAQEHRLTLMRDLQGTAAEKLALFQKLRAAGGFAKESEAELRKVEYMLRTFAAAEKS